MAERRMLTKKVTDDDHFQSLSASAQALYLHLTMSADDDGFCNQVSVAMFKAHASVQDLHALLENRYILQFESGVIVIKHWRMANALRKDRYTATAFKEEMAKLRLKDNGVYTFAKESDEIPEIMGNDERLPSGCRLDAVCPPQVRLDKVRLDKDRLNNTPLTPQEGESTGSVEEYFGYDELLLEAVNDWIAYKKEQKKPYKPMGLKSLLTTIQKNVNEYGADAVVEVIRESMSANYQGIVWDRLKGRKPKGKTFYDFAQEEAANDKG